MTGTTRREFVTRAASAVAAFGALPVTARCEAPSAHAPVRAAQPAPVVSFFMDQPYLDLTGRDLPYIPPAGLRSAAPLAELSEEAFLGAHCWR